MEWLVMVTQGSVNRWHYINCSSPRFTIQKCVSGTEFLQKTSVYDIVLVQSVQAQRIKDTSLSDIRTGHALALLGTAKALRTSKALLLDLFLCFCSSSITLWAGRGGLGIAEGVEIKFHSLPRLSYQIPAVRGHLGSSGERDSFQSGITRSMQGRWLEMCATAGCTHLHQEQGESPAEC